MNFSLQTHGADKAIDFFTMRLPKITREAGSRAVNDTLKEVQGETHSILDDKFMLRGRGKQWWEPGQKFGFNIRPFSNPNTMSGTLGSGADWLKLQEHGGTKKSADHRLAIPASDYKPLQAIMARGIKPRAILSDWDKAKRNLDSAQSALSAHRGVRLASSAEKRRRHDLKLQASAARREFRAAEKARKAREHLGAQTGSKAFIAEMKSGFVGIFKRIGKERTPLKLLFTLTQTAGMEPHLAWERTAQELANERYDRKFAIHFAGLVK